MLKKITYLVNDQTRWCLLNSMFNELRYANSFSFYYSWIIICLFQESEDSIQQMITRILIERL